MIRICASILLVSFLSACATEKKKYKVVDLTDEVYKNIKNNSEPKKFTQMREDLLEKTTDEDLEEVEEEA